MKVVITGTTGFIGGHLLKAARALHGTDVAAFSSVPFAGNHIVYHSKEDFGLSSAAISLIKEADVLIHAGAFIPKSGAEANQIFKCNGNITFTEKLLELPWDRLKKVVFLSTVDVYANVNEAISELTPTVPPTLYGLSKLYGEKMVELYAAERGITSQVLRIGHVYGPGEEKYAKVLPKAIQNILTGKDVELWGEGKELRSFIYIDDVVSAILKAVELQGDPGIINVVSGNIISIRELLDKLIAIGNRGVGVILREYSGATRDYVFDNSKLKRYLLPEESDFMDGLQAEFRYFEALSASQR